MRATVSRDLELHDVFVGDSARLLPEGKAWQAAQRFPYMFATLSSTYLGIAQAAYDFTVQYLRAELPGMAAVRRRMYPTKQHAVAQMRIRLEQARALFLRTIGEAGIDPDGDRRQRLLGMHYTVMETAQWLCALALRTCGGQAVTKALPLERLYRDGVRRLSAVLGRKALEAAGRRPQGGGPHGKLGCLAARGRQKALWRLWRHDDLRGGGEAVRSGGQQTGHRLSPDRRRVARAQHLRGYLNRIRAGLDGVQQRGGQPPGAQELVLLS